MIFHDIPNSPLFQPKVFEIPKNKAVFKYLNFEIVIYLKI
jgi:hypothetical protein